MTYDYTTSTAFAVGGPTGGEAVYIVDLKTGLLTKIMETEQTFMSVTAGPDGKLYAAELGTSSIYVIDPGAETCELLTESGYFSFGVGSMSYDYENDIIYWTNYGTLGLLDPKTGESTSLGTIGPGGEMLEVMGLFTMSEHVPQEPVTYALKNLFLSAEKVILTEGATQALTTVALPMPPDRSGHLVFLQRKGCHGGRERRHHRCFYGRCQHHSFCHRRFPHHRAHLRGFCPPCRCQLPDLQCDGSGVGPHQPK